MGTDAQSLAMEVEEFEKGYDASCLVCFDLYIPQYDYRFSELSETSIFAQQALARKLTGHNPFGYDGRLFVEAKSLDATAEAGCLACALLKNIWERLRHTEQLCSGKDEMKRRQGFFLHYTFDRDIGELRALHLHLKNHSYLIHTIGGKSCLWDAIPSISWSDLLPTLDDVRLFVQRTTVGRWVPCHQTRQSSVLPTRLVMLNDGRPQGNLGTGASLNIRLIETSSIAQTFEDDARYIALSHCWGSPDVAARMLQTTTETIDAFSQSIPWADLTKTFQDAMLVAKHLGIRYIWIDSLCIVQDDAQDWAKEASRMTSVYENAHLTIAATGATDGNEGLFINTGNEPISRRGVHVIRLPGFQSTIYVRSYLRDGERSRSRHFSLLDGLGDVPLVRRCWAFQERLLSPSMLHFTKDELILEDNGLDVGCVCECKELNHVIPGSYTVYACGYPSIIEGDPVWKLRRWCAIVEDYAWRSLTSEADRLPALSGVAAQFQRQLPGLGSYLAGLWEADILFGLHWKTRGPVRPRLRPTLARKTLLSAPPTWSWASVGGSKIEWPSWNKEVNELVEIISAACFPLTSDDKGMVRGGRITLRGRLCLVALDLYPHSSTTDAGSYNFTPLDGIPADSTHRRMEFTPDIALCADGETLPAVYFLPLSLEEDIYQWWWALRGLVLCRETKEISTINEVEHPTKGTTVFSRVGYAEIPVVCKVQEEYRARLSADADYYEPDDARFERQFAEWRNTVFNKLGQEQVLTIV